MIAELIEKNILQSKIKRGEVYSMQEMKELVKIWQK
jgi:hypothetical protein